MSNTDIILRKAERNEQDALLYKQCFDQNDSPKKIEKVKWMLFDNAKTWIQFATVATPAEKVVGILATIPLRMKYFSRSIFSGQYIDTMTDKEFRGKGLFGKLAWKSYDALRAEDCEIGWGFPNENAVHGWFNKFGWKEIGEVPFLLKPIRTRYLRTRLGKALRAFVPDIPLYLKKNIRIPEGYALEELDSFDNSFNDLWESFSAPIGIGVIRDAAYLNWRFVKKPFENYLIRCIRNKQNGSVEAAAVYCVKEKHGGRIGYIMELMNKPGSGTLATTLLQHALNDLKDKNADLALAWCFSHSPNFGIYRSGGFFKLPRKMQFIKMYFGGIRLLEEEDTRMFEKTNWYLSYSDSDTV